MDGLFGLHSEGICTGIPGHLREVMHSSDLRHGSSLHFGLLSFFLALSAISFHFYLNICA